MVELQMQIVVVEPVSVQLALIALEGVGVQHYVLEEVPVLVLFLHVWQLDGL